MLPRLPGVPGRLWLLLFLVLSASGDATAQTLEDALAAAYLNNPMLLGQRTKVQATDEKVSQALSKWRPSVEITGSVGVKSVRNTNSTDPRQHRDPKSIGLTLTQPLFRGGRTIAATREAENAVRAERARLLKTEQGVLLGAATAFLDVFKDEAVLNLNIKNEQVLRRQLEAIRDRFEVGEITRTDVHQGEARQAGAVADRISAEGDLEVSRAAYLNVVGMPAPKTLVAVEVPSGLPKSRDEAAKAAAVNNPSVVSAEYDRLALSDNVDEVMGELLPSLSVSTGLSRRLQSGGEDGRIDTAEMTLNLTIPLYQQGVVFSRVRQAKQEVAKQLQVIDQARRDAVEEASKAWESMLTARARLASFTTQINANVVALEGVRREAQVGSRTVLEVLDAEQELLDSRVSHVKAGRDELRAIFELKASMGRLTIREMKLPVAPYDPVDYYQKVRDKWFGTDVSGGPE